MKVFPKSNNLFSFGILGLVLSLISAVYFVQDSMQGKDILVDVLLFVSGACVLVIGGVYTVNMVHALAWVKTYLRRHKRLLGAARFVTRWKPPLTFSWSDVGCMVDDWAKFLPCNFDCVIGIPRSGLVVADYLALDLGLPLSTPDDYLRGVVWQSKSILPAVKFGRVLVVEDSVSFGRNLVYEVQRLRKAFPDTVFVTAVLVDSSGGRLKIDYVYVQDLALYTNGERHKTDSDGKLRNAVISYDDFM